MIICVRVAETYWLCSLAQTIPGCKEGKTDCLLYYVGMRRKCSSTTDGMLNCNF